MACDAAAAPPPGTAAFTACTPRAFATNEHSEPHVARRKAILAAHPEVRALFGVCPRTRWTVLLVVVLQLASASAARALPPGLFCLFAWLWGGLLSSNLFLAGHEASHNLAFETPRANKLLAVFANLPVVIPFSVSFGKYHRDHHTSQGTQGADCDLPHPEEAALFAAYGPAGKFVWMLSQLLFYAVRPLLTVPKPPGLWEGINAAACLAFDALLLGWSAVWGPKALAYLLLSMLGGGGFHPAGAHFIAEHYLMPLTAAERAAEVAKSPAEVALDARLGRGAAQETWSYYGPWNALTYHVGYHTEHHDFPRIPGSRLATLRAMCPEFYGARGGLRSHVSYGKVLYSFLFDSAMGPFSRVVRPEMGKQRAA